MDKDLRNTLRIMVTQARKILEIAIQEQLQGIFGIHTNGNVEPAATMVHLSQEDQYYRAQILIHLQHIQASGFSVKDAVEQLVREVAYTHLNRLSAYKMMEKRKIIPETVSRSLKSRGFLLYLSEHPEEELLWSSGKQDVAYRHFLEWRAEKLSEEIGVLFSPNDPANRLFPPQRILDEVLALINSHELENIWAEDEAIGWVYQYFTPKELRDKARNESQAPRNSYELAFRNQFYTPSYVVQFLTDNTLGRIWYEMCQGQTRLTEQCTYMVRRPDEVFFAKADSPKVEEAQEWLQGKDVSKPNIWSLAHTVNAYNRTGGFREGGDEWLEKQLLFLKESDPKSLKTQELLDLLFLFCRKERFCEGTLESHSSNIELILAVLNERVHLTNRENRSQEEALHVPFFIPYRPIRDPRSLKILDPACGSGHFLLYCFELLETIYLEAYEKASVNDPLRKDYPTLSDLQSALPGLILANNLHGIDIDLRATQIASLALWLRCKRSYQDMSAESNEHPKIVRSNIVCAEPMPGEKDLLEEFTATLQPKVLGTLVETIFDKMRLASEAGSLLKIESEIKEAILEAKQRWRMRPQAEQLALWESSGKADEKSLLNENMEITDAAFWTEAESRVIEVLHTYATTVTNGKGLARKLFADDTAQGFAFIDICQKSFDVVLMNPPFGKCSVLGQHYFDEKYSEFKSDIGIAFVDRWVSLLREGGLVGAITSRTFIASDSLEKWRNRVLLKGAPLQCLIDLGYGVLDDAMVEAAAYVVAKTPQVTNRSYFIRLLEVQDKELAVKECFEQNRTLDDLLAFEHRLEDFRKVPLSILCYWLPSDLIEKIVSRPNLISSGGAARHGLVTTDDFRFLRTAWEVPIELIGRHKRWVFLAKGGEYQPYWDDIHLVIDWQSDGSFLKSFLAAKRLATQGSADWSPWLNHHEFYFSHGLTYPERTTSDFCPRILPRDIIFSSTGQVIQFGKDHLALSYLGGSFVPLFRLIIESFVGSGDNSVSGSAAKHYRSGLLNVLPSPIESLSNESTSAVIHSIDGFRTQANTDETTRLFLSPFIPYESIKLMSAKKQQAQIEHALNVLKWNYVIEAEVNANFRLTEADQEVVSRLVGKHPLAYEDDTFLNPEEISELWLLPIDKLIALGVKKIGARRQITKKSYIANRRLELISHILGVAPTELGKHIIENNIVSAEAHAEMATSVLSYLLGSLFGRWDVRITQDSSLMALMPDPFAPLPACPPGTLIGPNGLPATPGHIVSEEWLCARPNAVTLPSSGGVKQLTIPDSDYPLRINWDGILVDDLGNENDVLQRIRETLTAIWHDRAEAIEQEISQILGIKELREYFRKPGNGGFWTDHIQRYSKSRRKAPIYWLLQSAKKNYAVWLYYHRLNKDTLFKVLNNIVEPKLRLEETKLEQLRIRLVKVGTAGREAKQLERQLERQENFISELEDFRDKLRRAADLNLDPDFNDGVVLNIAPLWELVPWNEAKRYWQELRAGKYEWSTIGKQLRERGLA